MHACAFQCARVRVLEWVRVHACVGAGVHADWLPREFGHTQLLGAPSAGSRDARPPARTAEGDSEKSRVGTRRRRPR